VAHPNFKTGRRSKYLSSAKGELAKAYRASLRQDDESLLSLREDVALLESRVGDLLKSLYSSAKAPPWGSVVDLLVDAEMALRSKDQAKFRQKFAKLGRVIREGAEAAGNRDRVWESILLTLDQKSRTSGQEVRRQLASAEYINSQVALFIFTSILETVKTVAHNRLSDSSEAKRLVAEVAMKVHEMLPTARVIDNQPAEESEDA
jgi:hypothetical protein